MSHNVDKMMSVREKPWHFALTGDRTTITQEYPATFAEARRLGGLAWDLAAKEAWVKNFDNDAIDSQIARVMLDASWETLSTTERVKMIRSVIDTAYTADPLFTRYARSDDNRSLSYMMPSWNPIRIADIEPIVEALFAAAGKKIKLLIETCGSLDDGRALWVLIKLDQPLEFTKDQTYTFPYLALTCRHDGTASLSAILTLIRIICWNTFRAAEAAGQKSGAMYSFTHRTKWQNQIAEAAVALQFAQSEIDQYSAAMSELLGMNINQAKENEFVETYFNIPVNAGKITQGNVMRARETFRGILASDTIEGAGIRGTAGGLVQAAGEFLDYFRRTDTPETGLRRNVLTSQEGRARAARLAFQLAA